MANIVKHSVMSGLTTYLSTQLNALANGANKLGAAIDNTSNRNTKIMLDLFIAEQGSARSTGANVVIYLLESLDGTNYSFGGDALDPSFSSPSIPIAFDAATGERHQTVVMDIKPCKFKILVMNETGQALAATLNTLKYATYNPEIQ